MDMASRIFPFSNAVYTVCMWTIYFASVGFVIDPKRMVQHLSVIMSIVSPGCIKALKTSFMQRASCSHCFIYKQIIYF